MGTEAETQAGGWPADVHVVGKDIVRFHAVYWPALLLALGLALPRQVLSHAHWTLGRRKMSKSVGNVVNPFYAMDRFGVDALRYYLVHDGGIEHDGDYGNEHIVDRYKKGLHGGLGNLLGRIVRTKRWSVREAVCAGVPEGVPGEAAAQMAVLRAVADEADAHMQRLDPRAALRAVMRVVYETNKFLQREAPWALAKQLDAEMTDSDRARLHAHLHAVVYLAAEALRIVGILLQPVMPDKAAELLDVLGVAADRRTFADAQLGVDADYGQSTKPMAPGPEGSLFPPLPVED